MMMLIKKTVFTKKNILNKIPISELKGLILLTGMLTAGFIFGAGLAGKVDTVLFSKMYNILLPNDIPAEFTSVLTESLSFKLMLISVAFVFGMSCIGMPLMFVLPLIQGMIYGFNAGYLYSCGNTGNIGFYILAVLPSAVIFSILLIIICNNGASMSYNVIKAVSGKTQTENELIRTYVKKFCIIICITLITAAAEAGAKTVFAGLFTV